MDNHTSRRLVPWALLFLYVPFLYQYGARLDHLTYVDFPSFYYGAQLTFHDRSSPYDLAALRGAANASNVVYPYLYSPPSLLALAPLSHLRYHIAEVAVLVMNHAFVLATLYVFP